MATTTKLVTINDIKTHNRVSGGHWFDPDTMRFHGTRVHDEVYQGPGGVFFTTSDKAGFRDSDGREYNVRRYDPETGSVGTAGGGGSFKTKARAVRHAMTLAGTSGATTAEGYKPVTVLEQFVHDLRTHGSETAAPLAARELIQLSKRHHVYMERDCNHGGQYDDESNPKPWLRKCRERIRTLAGEVGAAGVIFEGATVKLTFKDGATNDFGSEGWVVPTSEKAE